jgi:prepilin-type processing-associated H-X9-DG protein
MGVPEGRWGPKVVTSFLDGHVEPLTLKELDDMRLWSNEATAVDFDYAK